MRKHYPTPAEIDRWAASLWRSASRMKYDVRPVLDFAWPSWVGVRHSRGRFVRFSPGRMADFYCYYQPAASTPAPLAVHVPGYGTEISAHPELESAGFTVLHVNPLGYHTPKGPNEAAKGGAEAWPVLPRTARGERRGGYRDWLLDCLVAIRWAWRQGGALPDRVSFFGTSQGGGTALLLGSIFRDHGARCVAADEPFLTDFPLGGSRGPYGMVAAVAAEQSAGRAAEVWRNVGFIDTTSHAHRLTMPVLLTAGLADETCPPDTIASLFEKLPGTRSLTCLRGQGHAYTREFLHLAASWFRLYA